MTQENGFQTAVDELLTVDTPVNDDVEALSEEAAIEENTQEVVEELPAIADPEKNNEPSPADIQAIADKNAIDMSGKTHLDFIYQGKVNASHAKVANIVATIMSKEFRVANWTHEEVATIWNRVESEI